MGWSSQLCNNYLRENLFMELYAPSLNRPVATSVKFSKLNTNQRNKLHLNPIEWLFFAINGKPKKSYFNWLLEESVKADIIL